MLYFPEVVGVGPVWVTNAIQELLSKRQTITAVSESSPGKLVKKGRAKAKWKLWLLKLL